MSGRKIRRTSNVEGIPAATIARALGLPLWGVNLARRAAGLPPGEHTLRVIADDAGRRYVAVNNGRPELLSDPGKE